MAKRIRVILSQAPRSSSSARQMEEDLVAALLLEDGVEVSVVPHLEHLEANDTGLLCLEGVGGDMIVCCWMEAASAWRLLRQKGILGRLGHTTLETEAERKLVQRGAEARTLYLLDLRQASSIGLVRREIHRISDEAQTTTFQILGVSPSVSTSPAAGTPAAKSSPDQPHAAPPPAQAPPAKSPPAKSPPAKAPPAKSPPAKSPPAKAPPAKAPPAKAPAKSPPVLSPTQFDAEEQMETELDDLLDEFDRTEI